MLSIIACSVLLLLILAYLFMICPNIIKDRKESMRSFEAVYIAHRGFFDNKGGVPENSLSAFQRAVDFGYGIELDVQLSRDGYLLVFHDDSMERMCGINMKLRDMDYKETQSCHLLGTSERIPLFTDVLKIVDGKVPLIVEVKYEGDVIATTKALATVMDSYHGDWCMESFDPRSLRWFKNNRPSIIRGQLSTDYWKDDLQQTFVNRLFLTNLMYNSLGRPDFIAYNHKYYTNISLNICRFLFSPGMVAWTIKSKKELELAGQHHFDIFIFDGFDPGLVNFNAHNKS